MRIFILINWLLVQLVYCITFSHVNCLACWVNSANWHCNLCERSCDLLINSILRFLLGNKSDLIRNRLDSDHK